LAKKFLAELETAEALKKLADQARLAGMSIEDFALFKVKTLNTKIDTYIEDMTLSIIRELNARIAAMLAKFNFTSPTSGGGTSDSGSNTGGNIIYSSAVQKFAIESTAKLNDKIQDYLSGFSMGGVQRSSSQSPMDIKITVDAGGDRLSQAIAESIQVATRSGYSTVPAGFLV